MNATATAARPVALSAGRSWRDFRVIPPVDTFPLAVSFVQTLPGKLLLLALFGAGLAYLSDLWLPLTVALAAITFFPAYRRALVTAGTLIFTIVLPWRSYPVPAYTLALYLVVFVTGAALFLSAARWPRSWFGQRPLLSLYCGFFWLVALVDWLPHNTWYYAILWDYAYLLSTYVSFFGYSLLDATSASRDPLVLQAGVWQPFWGSTNTPFAKGAAYLRSVEARDSVQLAVTQLKGAKLLAWSILLSLFGKLLNYCAYARLHFPAFPDALHLSVNRQPLPWYLCWASLITSFSIGLVYLSVLGHQIIACVRMAGFRALRNTYRPLSSRTVAEFFNRYFFYFKELLVDFFFYPTFLRYFKKHPRLRKVAAIFAAAFLGNALFHFRRDLNVVQEFSLVPALVNFQVYIFYCFALATAISISDLRKRSAAPRGFIRGQLIPSATVLLTFCLLDVFGSTRRNYPLIEHLRFFAHLFNINL